jgi:hypothetical protein
LKYSDELKSLYEDKISVLTDELNILREDNKRMNNELDNNTKEISRLRELSVQGMSTDKLKDILGDDFNDKIFDDNKSLNKQIDELKHDKHMLESELDK